MHKNKKIIAALVAAVAILIAGHLIPIQKVDGELLKDNYTPGGSTTCEAISTEAKYRLVFNEKTHFDKLNNDLKASKFGTGIQFPMCSTMSISAQLYLW